MSQRPSSEIQEIQSYRRPVDAPSRVKRAAEFVGKIILWCAGGAGAAVVFIIWLYTTAEPASPPAGSKKAHSGPEAEAAMYEAANQFLNEKLDSETAKAAAAEKQAEEWHRRYTNLAFSIDEIVRPLNAEAKLASPDPNAWERFELAHDFGSDLRRINAALKTGAAWRAKFDDLANTVDLMHGVLTNTQSPQPAADVIKKWEAISDYAAELAIEFAPLAIDGPIEPRVRRAIAVER